MSGSRPPDEEDPHLRALLGYYRDRTTLCARRLSKLHAIERPAEDDLAEISRVTRERALWVQLADELDAYLAGTRAGVEADTPGLF